MRRQPRQPLGASPARRPSPQTGPGCRRGASKRELRCSRASSLLARSRPRAVTRTTTRSPALNTSSTSTASVSQCWPIPWKNRPTSSRPTKRPPCGRFLERASRSARRACSGSPRCLHARTPRTCHGQRPRVTETFPLLGLVGVRPYSWWLRRRSRIGSWPADPPQPRTANKTAVVATDEQEKASAAQPRPRPLAHRTGRAALPVSARCRARGIVDEMPGRQ